MTWTAARSASPTIRSDDETRARVALACAGLSGDATVGAAIRRFGGATQLVYAARTGTVADSTAGIAECVLERIASIEDGGAATDVISVSEQLGLTIVTPNQDSWPRGMDALSDAAPLALWVRGLETVLTEEATAIVGPRHPSREARHATLEFATSLADQGWVVASGVAPGVEQLALKAARAMRGTTIEVTPVGLDRHLAEDPGASVTVSAAPPGAAATAHGVRLARQVLAALATRMIVVDDAQCMNARMTADAARALGRPVGVAATTC
ncbi:DNA-processing protein DprA [Agromyces sp. NPDC004153]